MRRDGRRFSPVEFRVRSRRFTFVFCSFCFFVARARLFSVLLWVTARLANWVHAMDTQEFREFGKAAVDFIADYFDTIRNRDVLPSVQPGYLQKMIPSEAPQKGESWKDILNDVERVVLPGLTHWHSPHFHGYYPTANSFPAVVGEMMSAGFGIIGFNWIASPACTELEVAVMDWLGKLLGLPEEFLNCSEGPGGGVIQSTASEATLIALLAAKEKFVRAYKESHPEMSEAEVKGKLVGYSSDQSNSSIEKAGLIGSMTMRLLPSNLEGQLEASVLEEAIQKDLEDGLIPCYVVATLGTTPTCAFDDLEDLGMVCQQYGLWLHVDAAYAGSAFSCPEYRYLMKGVERSDSFNFNPHKWMLVNFDCSAMWVKNARHLVEAFNVERIYLKHKHEGATPEYLHWQIPLGRKFRALKLWFVLKSYGVEGIQQHVRAQIALAKYFETLLHQDDRFEVRTSSMGLTCFKLRGDKEGATQELHDKILSRKKVFVVPCKIRGDYVIRFVITSRLTTAEDVEEDYAEIVKAADEVLPKKKMFVGQEEVTKGNNISIQVDGNVCVEKSK